MRAHDAYRGLMDARELAVRKVAVWYLRDGYVRGPIPDRLLLDGWKTYKKGWEMRISIPADPAAVAEIRAQIDRAGLRLARVYGKRSSRLIQPIYGRDQVLRVLKAAGIDTAGM